MTGVARNTVTTLLLDLAEGCAGYHDRHVRNRKVRRLQCDEIWNFVGAKAKNTTPQKKAEGWGDTWTWTAVDADTKLCVSYLLSGERLGWATEFMLDCAHRISNRVQITIDGHRAYMKPLSARILTMRSYRRFTVPQQIEPLPSFPRPRAIAPTDSQLSRALFSAPGNLRPVR